MSSLFQSAAIRTGFHQIWAHKVRSGLTVLGIVLGVAATMAVVGMIQGLFANWIVWFTSDGGLEKIFAERVAPPAEQAKRASASPGFTLRDAEVILRTCPLIAHVSPEMDVRRPSIQRRGKTARTWLMQGVARGNQPVGNYEVARGRFITDLDVEQAAAVAVLGAQVVRELFETNEDALHQLITINGQPFRVIGVYQHYSFIHEGWREKEAKSWLVSVPVTAVQKRLARGRRLTWLNAEVADVNLLGQAVAQVENILSFTHNGIRDYRVNTHEDLLQETSAVATSYSFTLGGIAAVSLIVGGIGIMNVMLASLHERIREIGLRKAIGARPRDIFAQFLGEAVALAMLGGIVGVGLGAGIISFLQTASFMVDTPAPLLSFQAAAVAFGFSVAVGILSGLYPAARAAGLDPIVALRYE